MYLTPSSASLSDWLHIRPNPIPWDFRGVEFPQQKIGSFRGIDLRLENLPKNLALSCGDYTAQLPGVVGGTAVAVGVAGVAPSLHNSCWRGGLVAGLRHHSSCFYYLSKSIKIRLLLRWHSCGFVLYRRPSRGRDRVDLHIYHTAAGLEDCRFSPGFVPGFVTRGGRPKKTWASITLRLGANVKTTAPAACLSEYMWSRTGL